jgi:hypothetical protein
VSQHKYKVIYDFEAKPEGLTKEEVPEGKSATDSLLCVSILYPEDGSLSVYILGVDGRTGEMPTDHEMYKVWMMLTKRMANSQTLSPNRRANCAAVWQMICETMRGGN